METTQREVFGGLFKDWTISLKIWLVWLLLISRPFVMGGILYFFLQKFELFMILPIICKNSKRKPLKEFQVICHTYFKCTVSIPDKSGFGMVRMCSILKWYEIEMASEYWSIYHLNRWRYEAPKIKLHLPFTSTPKKFEYYKMNLKSKMLNFEFEHLRIWN